MVTPTATHASGRSGAGGFGEGQRQKCCTLHAQAEKITCKVLDCCACCACCPCAQAGPGLTATATGTRRVCGRCSQPDVALLPSPSACHPTVHFLRSRSALPPQQTPSCTFTITHRVAVQRGIKKLPQRSQPQPLVLLPQLRGPDSICSQARAFPTLRQAAAAAAAASAAANYGCFSAAQLAKDVEDEDTDDETNGPHNHRLLQGGRQHSTGSRNSH